MPDDEPFEYLATQAIADFLATEASAPIDGIIFPSAQAAEGAFNVVLFHKAARVEPMNVRDGTEISASDWRADSLRIVPESVAVHRVTRVEFVTDEFTVKRRR